MQLKNNDIIGSAHNRWWSFFFLVILFAFFVWSHALSAVDFIDAKFLSLVIYFSVFHAPLSLSLLSLSIYIIQARIHTYICIWLVYFIWWGDEFVVFETTLNLILKLVWLIYRSGNELLLVIYSTASPNWGFHLKLVFMWISNIRVPLLAYKLMKRLREIGTSMTRREFMMKKFC